MPKIGDYKPVSETKCERCNSKRKVSKTWTEKIKNDHGQMILYHSQIICTNKECQKEFEKNMNEEILKREKLKQTRTEEAARRVTSKTQ
jgi:hypothetical protein